MTASPLFLLHQPPTLFLDTTLSRLNGEQLDALLEFRIAHGISLTLIVVLRELVLGSIGMNPLGAATTGQERDEREQ